MIIYEIRMKWKIKRKSKKLYQFTLIKNLPVCWLSWHLIWEFFKHIDWSCLQQPYSVIFTRYLSKPFRYSQASLPKLCKRPHWFAILQIDKSTKLKCELSCESIHRVNTEINTIVLFIVNWNNCSRVYSNLSFWGRAELQFKAHLYAMCVYVIL